MITPMLEFEQGCWARGITCLAGVDEVGRGPLAGPVVAAAVVMDPAFAVTSSVTGGLLDGLTDSKALTAAQRERFAEILSSHATVRFGFGRCEPAEIDALNILNATHVAMARALAALALPMPAHALVDGRPVRGLPCPSTAIVGGDGRSLLIAAASVLAKVSRDREMRELDTRYPGYGFGAHKGYGTSEHIQALLERGPCPIHRRSFRPVREAEDLHRRQRAAASAQDDVHVVVET